jgi:hypothetical protein
VPVSDVTTRFMNDSLNGPLQRLETERRAALFTLKRTRRRLKLGVTGAAFVMMVATGPFGLILGSLPLLCVYFFLAGRARDRLFAGALRDEFKQDMIRPLVAHLAPLAVYRPDGHIRREEFEKSGLYQVEPSVFGGDDLVEGRLGDVDLRFSELNVEHVDSSDRSGRRATFKGLFFVADFHKDFAGFTIVRPRRPRVLGTYASGASRAEKMNAGLAYSEHLMAARWSPAAGRYAPLQPVELEDPAFAECFDVFATDQVEARYILSPGMMQRLLEFRQEAVRAREELSATLAARRKFFQMVDQKDMESGMFYVSFARSNVYMAKHHYRDLFEIEPERPLTSAAIEGYAADLQFAFGIVEDLNLNTRIWSKAPTHSSAHPVSRHD